ncbi:uncharacterized protein BDW43DRAFT_160538 [Aspergillus alliaceus]|uniref:uncharacterized protein n=1 Tax=Petromyces alliaceus TaxID=209559 RepID=UPI0012A68864|nr:uncharacterized protein BDW43DRAFT_160538 [Aspergillus alliaceus]KAB8230586.1 hypothetical protein BDW43DRAFT_160538 [Aspergillus alliaceus]
MGSRQVMVKNGGATIYLLLVCVLRADMTRQYTCPILTHSRARKGMMGKSSSYAQRRQWRRLMGCLCRCAWGPSLGIDNYIIDLLVPRLT